uniref:Gamma-tubulin complex component n=2 Tax=Trichuris muris TaxID=70415 RepID=A0A5S6PZE0_TRIMR
MKQILLVLLGYDSKDIWQQLVEAGSLQSATTVYINSMVDLGSSFRYICEQIETYRCACMDKLLELGSSGQTPSMYLNAVFMELENTVLTNYRNTLLELDSELQSESACNIIKIFHRVKPYHVLLESVSEMCQELINSSCRGAQVFAVVHRWAAFMPFTCKEIFDRLITRCQLILLEQLELWLSLHTHPISDEFFIQATDGRHSATYEVVEDMMPLFMDTALAETILSIGLKVKEIGGLIDQKSRSSDFSDFVSFHERNICRLRELMQTPLTDFELQELFEHWHSCIDRRLWGSLSTKADLEVAFDKIEDYFFQRQGYLFDQLIRQFVEDPLARHCRPSVGCALPDKLFNLAADCVHHAAHRCVVQLKFCWIASEDQSWLSCLELELRPEQIRSSGHLYSPNFVSRCNEIFRFLLRVRYSHYLLNNLWLSLAKGGAICKATFNYASTLNFVVSTLRDYQTNVIREHCNGLRTALDGASSMEAFSDLVDTFLENMESALFIHSPDAWLLIDKLLFMCECSETFDFNEPKLISCAWDALRELMTSLFQLGETASDEVVYLRELLVMLNCSDFFTALTNSIRSTDD